MKMVVPALAAVLLLGGCTGSSDSAPETRSTASADVEQQAQDEPADQPAEGAETESGRVTTVDVTIEAGAVSPQGGRVEVTAGTPVNLRVTSDVAEQIHVHSDPEHTYEVAAGGSISRTFTVDTPGQVAVEAHGLDVTIVQLVVRP